MGSAGIAAGCIVSAFMKISYTYCMVMGVGLVLVTVLIWTKRPKKILTAILFVTIPINIDKSLFLDESHIGGVPGLVLSAWSIALFSLYFIWCIEHWTGKGKKVHYFPWMTIPMVSLLMISVLSMTKSVRISLSLFQIFQMIKVFLLFFYIANNVRSEKDFKFILYLLFTTLIFEIGIGYYQYLTNDYVDLTILSDASRHKPRELGDEKIMSVSGTFYGDARFGDYLILVCFLVLASLMSRDKIYKKLIYFPMLSAGIILIVFTFSRGAWLGFGIGLLLFSVFQLFYSTKKPSTFLQFLLIVLVAATVFYVFKDLITERITGEDYGSAESRIPMMQIGYEMIKAHPILGVGINNYTRVMAFYDPTGLSYVWDQPVHNVFIQLTAEIGIFGLLSFIWICVMLYVYSIRSMSRSNDFIRHHVVGLTAGISALFVHGMVNNATIATDPFILFWAFVGLLCSIYQMSSNNQLVK